jgi:hypothetical protein
MKRERNAFINAIINPYSDFHLNFKLTLALGTPDKFGVVHIRPHMTPSQVVVHQRQRGWTVTLGSLAQCRDCVLEADETINNGLESKQMTLNHYPEDETRLGRFPSRFC